MDEPEDEDARQRANLIVAAIAILLVVLSVWLLIAFRKSTDKLDCIAAGHRNCQPLEQ